jgi:hypothetical protein
MVVKIVLDCAHQLLDLPSVCDVLVVSCSLRESRAVVRFPRTIKELVLNIKTNARITFVLPNSLLRLHLKQRYNADNFTIVFQSKLERVTIDTYARKLKINDDVCEINPINNVVLTGNRSSSITSIKVPRAYLWCLRV